MKTLLQIIAMAAIVMGIQSCNSNNAKKTAEAESPCCGTKTEEKAESCCSGKAEVTSSCCSDNKETKSCCSSAQVVTGDVQVYYFHATRRCATCEAVEKVTAQTLKEKFEGKVSFTSINREEDKDNPLLEQYKVNGQTLLLVKGDKVVNLTTDAFLNARSNPEKLQSKLVATVESLLN